jgi:hypothetical protein
MRGSSRPKPRGRRGSTSPGATTASPRGSTPRSTTSCSHHAPTLRATWRTRSHAASSGSRSRARVPRRLAGERGHVGGAVRRMRACCCCASTCAYAAGVRRVSRRAPCARPPRMPCSMSSSPGMIDPRPMPTHLLRIKRLFYLCVIIKVYDYLQVIKRFERSQVPLV